MSFEVYDTSGARIYDYDLTNGYLEPYEYEIRHEAEEACEEQGHWETMAVYYNHDGSERGKDVAWIVDVPAKKGHEAYIEKGMNYTYIPYTEEDRKASYEDVSKPSVEKQMEDLKTELETLKLAYLRGVEEA